MFLRFLGFFEFLGLFRIFGIFFRILGFWGFFWDGYIFVIRVPRAAKIFFSHFFESKFLTKKSGDPYPPNRDEPEISAQKIRFFAIFRPKSEFW